MAGPKLKIVSSQGGELAQLVDDWLADGRARGWTPASQDAARDRVQKLFLPWLIERGITTSAQLDQEVVNAYSRYLLEEHRTPKGTPLSRESVRSYMRHVRVFAKWSQERGSLEGFKVPMPPAPKRVLDVLTRQEMRAIEAHALSERDQLVIALLSETGMRLGELLKLRPQDLKRQGNERYLHVRGKGNRERLVAIGPKLFVRLEKYSKRPQLDEASTSALFTADRRTDGHYSPLSARGVQQLVRYAARRAGIREGKVNPHLFRHSFATYRLNNGYPIKHLQDDLGHADLSMLTKVYSHVTASDRYKSMLALMRKEEDE